MATVWQGVVTDWWDTQLREWQAWIQEDVYLAELRALQQIAYLSTLDDPAQRRKISNDVYDATGNAITAAIQKQTERESAIRHGQAEMFITIRTWLLVLG